VNSTRWAGLAGLVITLAAAPVLAQDLEARFRALDVNGDGFIRWNEAAGDACVERRFELADRNQDGQLDFGEFRDLAATCGPRNRS
jgi:hypothetical protein